MTSHNELIDKNFVWFQGVVEDRNDPLKLGRCRVRCVGFHTDNKDQLPPEDLPWAHPITPITSAAMNGIGQAPVGPVEGTWVVGFFRDGEDAQQPVIMGTLGGIPQEEADTSFGFSDPIGKYPKSDFIGEADTNRLARNENTENTIVQTKKDDMDVMDIATGIGSQDIVSEPDVPYAAQYPFNKVYESESGHIIEVDDTEGSERINIHHKSGTFIEIHPDGSMVRKVVGKNHEVRAGDEGIHVIGTYNITVEGNANIYTLGYSHTKTVGKHSIEVLGDYELNVAGSIKLNAGNGGSNITMDGSSIRETSGSIHLN
tara:strand:- start:748 stop:1692 length:945 start_codon:yes stop_codon:yes gene_type:complete